MAHHNYLIGHNTSPDRNKTNPSRLTALTPQNQPERPLLIAYYYLPPTAVGSFRTAAPAFRSATARSNWVWRFIQN